MKTKITLTLLCALFTLPAFATGKEAGGLGNPAAKLCIEVGGTSDADHPGFCRFDRALIEQWTLWSAIKSSTMATDTFLAHPSTQGSLSEGNPASVYCEKVGGQSEIAKTSNGDAYGVCAFPDRSKIEEWTLFLGPDANGKLMEVLALAIGGHR